MLDDLNHLYEWTSFNLLVLLHLEPSVGDSVTTPSAFGLRHISAPETKPTPTTPQEDPFKTLPPGQNICADCERLIV
jgi:hypothetical protein